MELSGKVIAVLEPKKGVAKSTGNEWMAQEYVIETHDTYPRKLCFEVFGAEKIQQFAVQIGEEITVSFDIDAREWNGRWFNSIRAWKVERSAAVSETVQASPVQAPAFAPINSATASVEDEKDDLPF